MKGLGIFFIFLMTMPALTVCASGQEVFAMGANGGSLPSQVDRQKIESGKEEREKRPDKGNSEEVTTKEKDGGNTEKAVPKKKPRLKYRDPYDCGC